MLAAPFRPRAAATAAALACTLAAWPAAQAQTINPATAPATAPSAAQAAAAIHLPAQPLAHSLAALAQRSGASLAYAPELVAGKQAATVQGAPGVAAALAQMLRGTGLQARQQGQTWTIQPAPPSAQAAAASSAGDAQTLPAVTVQAAPESATGPVLGYAARRSATATKTDTPLLETPQSISVIGAQELEMRQTEDVNQALSYVAGVHRSEGSDRTTDSFFIRGFSAGAGAGSLFMDGLKYKVQDYSGRMEPYGMERLELLKGASSVLYGMSGPGGVLNAVSKRPSAEPLRELRAELGSFSRKQIAGDFGGKLTEDGVWTWRLTGLLRDSDTFVDHIPDKRRFIAPALKWQPSANTALTLLAHYQHDRTAYLYGLPVEGTLLPNPNGRIPRERFIGEPDFDRYAHDLYALGYQFEHAFSPALKLRHNLRYFKGDGQYMNVGDDGWADDALRQINRYGVERYDRNQSLTSDTSLQYQWRSGGVQHTSLIGLDSLRQHDDLEQYNLQTQPLDVFTPRYGSTVAEREASTGYSPNTRTRRLGLYAQNQMKFGQRWVALLGGRYDRVRHSEWNFFTGERSADNERTSAFTGRAGLVYLAGNGWAPFASFSQSFEPQAGTDRTGARFKPTRGQQWELGLRYQPGGSRTLLSASLYQLTKRNNLVGDPLNPDFSVQLGKVRSRGLELEARTAIGKRANLIAAYAYTDARTIESSPLTPEEVGQRSGGVPRQQLSLWGDYRLADQGLPGLLNGLQVGAGLRHVGSTRGVWMGAHVPAYTVLDAMIGYDHGPWRLALNVSNLTGKRYIASCTYGCFYGEARKVTASVSWRW
ncbi:TonB-dependent siderophore receptor [Vandammella animalimorsus]|uniref:TonB-dependent siderophore receptor n=1 Tax=Vandammella animalimorsus TaxID=2029117 RepID=A0A2A2T966_9BURK|nr:TonB-dependent siderophore receptor [Vandammella animalimorsus]PAX18634.1 TonB-dependent siderophore receptor [Vandammella animalimorsus]PAX20797.1 TonB-dependent siderophore receptor [Vandammella animalimorsus]